MDRKWYFTFSVSVLYATIWFFSPENASGAFFNSLNIFRKVLPAFIGVGGLMFLLNLFIQRKDIKEKLSGREGSRAWLTAILSGIISSGPIYVWYPLLSQMKESGVSNSLISVFLYNRAVKLPLLPVLISYMGLRFTVVLTVLMVVFSVLQGMVFRLVPDLPEVSPGS